MDTQSSMRTVAPVSAVQFVFFRIVFGCYLLWHFILLLPSASELFSRTGVLADPALSPTYRLFPNLLLIFDLLPLGCELFVLLLAVGSLCITVGWKRRIVALLMWYGWACLLNRNPLISNPGIPYVGLLLVFLAVIPSGEPFARDRTRSDRAWKLPAGIYGVGWFLLAIGYTFSGLVKLGSPSWVDGTAMVHLVSNPLARPGPIRELFLAMPEFVTSFATYFSLIGEILFLPLSFSRKGRMIAWSWMVLMHIGILGMVAFADLTLGMLMMHLFLFDAGWLRPQLEKQGRIVVFFDGVCGLCNSTVQMLLDEDHAQVLRFATLQGEHAKRFVSGPLESIIVVDNFGSESEQVLRHSAAVFRALNAMGGFWKVVALLRFVPRPLRDWAYGVVARNRYRWFGQLDECRIMTPDVRSRFLD